MKARRKLLVGLMILALTVSSFGIVGNMSTVRATEDDGIPMYRMYNPVTGEHLYTKDENEKNYLEASKWNFEGYSWVAANEGQPVYRLFNKYSGEHHYTMDEVEKFWLVLTGWNDEGIGWYSKTTGDTCEVPVYRLFCPFTNEALKAHHYTMDKGERDWLLSIGWNDEGTCWTSMHNVITGTYKEATCSQEGQDGGARCKTCNKVYNARVLPKNPNNHQHTSYVPETTKVIDRGTALDHCAIYTCKICGEEVWRTGDSEITGLDHCDTCINHLNSKHGTHYHTYADVENGIMTEDEFAIEVEEVMSHFDSQVISGYYDTVVISPAHYRCDDCGKDLY